MAGLRTVSNGSRHHYQAGRGASRCPTVRRCPNIPNSCFYGRHMGHAAHARSVHSTAVRTLAGAVGPGAVMRPSHYRCHSANVFDG